MIDYFPGSPVNVCVYSSSLTYRWELRPPLIEKLFPVHRPSGLNRADWNLFYMIFEKKKNCFHFFRYFLVNKK